MPWRCMKALAKALELSSCAAALVGPKTRRPAGAEHVDHAGRQRRLGADHGQRDLLALRRSRPAAVDVGDRHVLAAARRARCRRCRAPRRRSAPWATAASFQASACSRPPPPTTRTFMQAVYSSMTALCRHVLHVVQVFQRVEQLLHPDRVVAGEFDRRSRLHRHFGEFRLEAGRFQRVLDGHEVVRRASALRSSRRRR